MRKIEPTNEHIFLSLKPPTNPVRQTNIVLPVQNERQQRQGNRNAIVNQINQKCRTIATQCVEKREKQKQIKQQHPSTRMNLKIQFQKWKKTEFRIQEDQPNNNSIFSTYRFCFYLATALSYKESKKNRCGRSTHVFTFPFHPLLSTK